MCIPGAATACSCPDGRVGDQTCNPLGTSLGTCICTADAGRAPVDVPGAMDVTDAPLTLDAATTADLPVDQDLIDSSADAGELTDSGVDVLTDTGTTVVDTGVDVPTDSGTVVDTGVDVRIDTGTVVDTGVDVPTDRGVVVDAGGPCPAGMALVPAGMFLMGDPMSDDTGSQPVHGVSLSAYCMDITEVTVGAYATCAAAGCTTPATGMACNQGVAGRTNHPVNCVSWNQARAYCQSQGGDLPTEAQWEYAARGSDGRTWPWGNDTPTTQLCWSGVTTLTTTCPVGSFPSGASPFGMLDMAGNVWEWTLDYIAPYTGNASSYTMDPTGAATGLNRVNRGGSSGNSLTIDVRSEIRFGGAPTRQLDSLGFRCAHGVL